MVIENNNIKEKKIVKKDKILIICSCIQKNLFLQQNIIFVNQFIDKLKEKYEIVILTSRDTLMLIVPDYVKIIIQNISKKNIYQILKKEKINKIIPIDLGDFDKNKDFNLKYKKVDNFFSSFFSSKYNNRFFLKKSMKISDFYSKKEITERKNIHTIHAVAIKDEFENQIILDVFENIKYNNKNIYCSSVLIDTECEKKIYKILDKFGKNLKVKKYPYTLTFLIDKNNNICFKNIQFGLTDELVFALQRQNINLVEIMLKITKKIPIFFQKSNDIIAISDYFDNLFSINFIENLNDFKESKQCRLCFLDCQHELNKIEKVEHNVSFNNFILVSIGDDQADNINNLLIFCKICNLISEKTIKRPLILVKKFLPIFQLIKNSHIVVCNVINEDSLRIISKKYNIKEAYIVQSTKNIQIFKLLKKLKIKIFPLNKSNNIFLYNSSNLIKDCKKNNYLFRMTNLDFSEKTIYFSCIVDNYKNIAFSSIISFDFESSLSLPYYTFPGEEIHHSLYEEINDIALNIISKNKSISGLLTITFTYKHGNIYVNNVNLNNFPLIFFLNKDKISLIYNAIISIMLNENIKSLKCNNTNNKMPKFYKKICFEYFDKQIVELEGLTKNIIFNKLSN